MGLFCHPHPYRRLFHYEPYSRHSVRVSRRAKCPVIFFPFLAFPHLGDGLSRISIPWWWIFSPFLPFGDGFFRISFFRRQKFSSISFFWLRIFLHFLSLVTEVSRVSWVQKHWFILQLIIPHLHAWWLQYMVMVHLLLIIDFLRWWICYRYKLYFYLGDVLWLKIRTILSNFELLEYKITKCIGSYHTHKLLQKQKKKWKQAHIWALRYDNNKIWHLTHVFLQNKCEIKCKEQVNI